MYRLFCGVPFDVFMGILRRNVVAQIPVLVYFLTTSMPLFMVAAGILTTVVTTGVFPSIIGR